MIAAHRIGRQIASAMRRDDLEPGKLSSVPSKIRCCSAIVVSSGLPIVFDEPAIALETLGKLRRALRMDEQHRAELFGLGPDRMKFWVGKILAQHAAADRRASQALLLDRGLKLLHREVGILQRQRREGARTGRAWRTELRQLLVLHLDDLRRRIAVLAIPERVDRQHFHVDRHRVHFLQALLDGDKVLGDALDRRQRPFRPRHPSG